MFIKHIEECKEACLQDLRTSKNKKIKKLMETIETELPANMLEDGLSSFISDVLGVVFMQEVQDEEEIALFVLEELGDFLAEIRSMKTLYTFEISLKGLEKELNRTIKISSAMKLSYFGYIILASFRAEASHLFNFEINNETFICDTQADLDSFEEEYILASDQALVNLDLKKNSKFSFNYDYGDNYDFEIKLKDIVVDEDFCLSIEDFVIDGTGFAIWEDAHYELSLYYNDIEKFHAFLKENKISKDNYPIDIPFDLNDCNEDVAENLFAIKLAYEDMDDEDEIGSLMM